ncbi:MAG: UDP-N-acetylglucosamine 2-epimerase (non-hydrolyzing) [Bacteroidia bacterium]|nr:UDP-N-acetylglucosamine 2-epimerase (non-hydrolyzing) [Bacteroidia bacterium]
MLKILNIIGARPQIIKAAAISRAIKNHFSDKIEDIIVHTGQHYDENMSEVFFTEMGIPKPKYNLNVGSASHGVQTAEMIKGIESIIFSEKPNVVLVYGDTNSTLAAAVAAAKLHIPVAHVEAGLRSFNKSMPEEINRITCDHASTLLFSPTETGISNLEREGFKINAEKPYNIDNPGVFHCGDVMYDNSIYFSEISANKSNVIEKYKLEKNNFVLATIHRDNNTDNPVRLKQIFEAIIKISKDYSIPFFIPLHPRTSNILKKNIGDELYNLIISNKDIILAPPVSFFDMIQLESNAKLVFTDSGGVQKEAYFFKKPCIILRSETEWVEIVKNGNAIICDADFNKIMDAWKLFNSKQNMEYLQIFGDSKASEFICEKLVETFE